MVAAKNRSVTGRIARPAFLLWVVLGLVACQAAPGGPVDDAPFVLTARGDRVLSDAPPGVEVTLNSKRLRPAREAQAPEQKPPAIR